MPWQVIILTIRSVAFLVINIWYIFWWSLNLELYSRRTKLQIWSSKKGKVRLLDRASNMIRRTKFRASKTSLRSAGFQIKYFLSLICGKDRDLSHSRSSHILSVRSKQSMSMSMIQINYTNSSDSQRRQWIFLIG